MALRGPAGVSFFNPAPDFCIHLIAVARHLT